MAARLLAATISIVICLGAAAAGAQSSPYLPTAAQLRLSGEQPRVAIAANGEVTAVWMHGFYTAPGCCSNFRWEVASATGSALSGIWDAPEVISMPGYSVLPEVAVDEHGDAAAVWRDYDSGNVDVAYRQAGSPWQPQMPISGPGESESSPRLLFEPDGDLLAWWARTNEGSAADEIALRSASTGTWQGPQAFSPGAHAAELEFGIDADGDLFAVWTSGGAIEASVEPAGSGTWQPPVTIFPTLPTGFSAGNIQLAVDGAGDVALLWQQVAPVCELPNPTPRCNEGTTLEAAFRSSATGRWSAPSAVPVAKAPIPAATETSTEVGPVKAPSHGAQHPQLAIDAAGDVVVAWTQVETSSTALEVSARPAASRTWDAPRILTAAPESFPFGAHYLAMDAYGRALVAWGGYRAVQASVGSATTNEWQEPVDVTPEGLGRGDEVHVAVDAAGDAVVLWPGSGYGPAAGMEAITFNLSTGVPGYRSPRPMITNASASRRQLRVRRKRVRGGRRAGIRFRFTLFPEADVRIRIEKLGAGRRVGETCLSLSTRRQPDTTRCTRETPIATIQEGTESAGVHSIQFDGSYQRRVALVGTRTTPARARTVYLQPGRYAAVLTASDSGGISPPVTLHFMVTH